jgi:hypothetical protein
MSTHVMLMCRRTCRRRGPWTLHDADEAPGRLHRLELVAAVGLQLPAAGLGLGEVDDVAEALEHLDDGLPGAREERVVEAGDEERDPHGRRAA